MSISKLIKFCSYDIMNFQERRGSYGYHKVGQWDNGKLELEQPFQWNPKTEKNDFSRVVESVCSKPCRRGEVKAGYEDIL